MKKLFFLVVALLCLLVLSNLSNFRDLRNLNQKQAEKKPILSFALVADSHGDDEQLAKALRQVFDRGVFDPEAQTRGTESAQGKGINLVIGLGDWTKVGTLSELKSAKEVFEKSKLSYFVTAGDHDLWDRRNRGDDPRANFREVFGSSVHQINRDGIQIVILDNSDIYKGISEDQWSMVNGQMLEAAKLRFVFAHKTPFHPDSAHIMGENSSEVAEQAQRLIALIEENKIDGFFAGDLHFFASYLSPKNIVKITTIGALTRERNFQGPRFAIITVYDDYSWEVEDVEIR